MPPTTPSTTASPPTPLDRLHATLVAPGATAVELALGYGAGAIGAVLGLAIGMRHDAAPVLLVVLALIGFDLLGGAAVNAMPSASARFHGRAGGRRHRLVFVALHGHVLLLALLVPALSWATALVLYAAVLAAAVLVEVAPPSLRRPIASAAAGLVIAVAVALLVVPPVVAWVVPLLAVKLLLGHLVPAR